jgi:outer membrane immunogenic protein
MRDLGIVAAALTSLGLAQSASAADLPRKAPMAAPIVAPVYNWTGFYVGVHAGWGRSESDASTTFLPSPAGFGLAPFTLSNDGDGFLAGGQIGFNYQISSWVVGLEADLSWTDINSTTAAGPLTPFGGGAPLAGTSYASSSDMNWFGTVRGRLGFAANNLLVYVTGGVAFADVDHATATAVLGPIFAGSTSETLAGWTIGGGFEWGLAPNWSLKAEYLYYDLGDTTVTGVNAFFPGAAVVTTFDNDGHILRVGVNYRFGGGGPVRY